MFKFMTAHENLSSSPLTHSKEQRCLMSSDDMVSFICGFSTDRVLILKQKNTQRIFCQDVQLLENLGLMTLGKFSLFLNFQHRNAKSNSKIRVRLLIRGLETILRVISLGFNEQLSAPFWDEELVFISLVEHLIWASFNNGGVLNESQRTITVVFLASIPPGLA